MLHLNSLNTHYGQAHILRDVSLRVAAGEVVALLGRNGAGKSTTMKAIIGMVPASAGSVHYRDNDLRRHKNYQRARLGIGYVPEERRIFRKLTVLENLATHRGRSSGSLIFSPSWTSLKTASADSFPAGNSKC